MDDEKVSVDSNPETVPFFVYESEITRADIRFK